MSKNITSLSAEEADLLLNLASADQNIFTIQEAYRHWKGDPNTPFRLRNLEEKGWLERLERANTSSSLKGRARAPVDRGRIRPRHIPDRSVGNRLLVGSPSLEHDGAVPPGDVCPVHGPQIHEAKGSPRHPISVRSGDFTKVLRPSPPAHRSQALLRHG